MEKLQAQNDILWELLKTLQAHAPVPVPVPVPVANRHTCPTLEIDVTEFERFMSQIARLQGLSN